MHARRPGSVSLLATATSRRSAKHAVSWWLVCAALVVGPSAALAEDEQVPKPPVRRGPHSAPHNLTFAAGELGGRPDGWRANHREDGYRIELTECETPAGTAAEGGDATGDATGDADGETPGRCVRMSRSTSPGEREFGNLMQSIDAVPLRGQRVRFRAAVRTEVDGGDNRAQMWLRVDRESGGMGFFDNMQDRPITSDAWKTYEILGEVAADAKTLNFGVMLHGTGTAWITDVSLEDVGSANAGNLGPRPFGGRGLENVVAFARLYGFVRHFHPTEAVAEADWDALAIEGVQIVESAENAEELAARLEALFGTVAPTLRVFPSGSAVEAEAMPGPSDDDDDDEVAYWNHRGVGTGSPRSIYSSRLLRDDGPSVADEAATAPSPTEPFRKDLAGGVSCIVPIAMYASGADGSMPSASSTPADTRAALLAPRPESWTPSGNDRATRLAAVVIAWNYFQHFYPYFDVVETHWPATLRRSLTSAATDEHDLAFLGTLRRLVADLEDGHGRVNLPGQGHATRVPLLWDWIEDGLVVTHAADEGAEGVAPGDRVVEIDGREPAAALLELEREISGATLQWRRFRSVDELARGPLGSPVELRVVSPGGDERTVTLRRTTAVWGDGALSEPRPAPVTDLGDGIVYVDLGRVDDATFSGAIPRLADAAGLVFDMRGYPRFNFGSLVAHLIDEPVTSAQWHVPTPRRPDREKMGFHFSNWTVQPIEPRFTDRVAFLTYGGAISAAETLMGIVEHYELGAIVGTATAGTNGNINPFTLPGNYHVTWTGMRVLKHDGSTHHGVGILPTVPVERTIAGLAAGRDEQLERAIELVRPAEP